MATLRPELLRKRLAREFPGQPALVGHLTTLGIAVHARVDHAKSRDSARRRRESAQRRRDIAELRNAADLARRYAADLPHPYQDADLPGLLTMLASSMASDLPHRGGQEHPTLAMLQAGIATTFRHCGIPLRNVEHSPAAVAFQVLAPIALNSRSLVPWSTIKTYIAQAQRFHDEHFPNSVEAKRRTLKRRGLIE